MDGSEIKEEDLQEFEDASEIQESAEQMMPKITEQEDSLKEFEEQLEAIPETKKGDMGETKDSLFVNIEIDPSKSGVPKSEAHKLATMKRKPLVYKSQVSRKPRKLSKGKTTKGERSKSKDRRNNRNRPWKSTMVKRKTRKHKKKVRPEDSGGETRRPLNS